MHLAVDLHIHLCRGGMLDVGCCFLLLFDCSYLSSLHLTPQRIGNQTTYNVVVYRIVSCN